MKPLNVLVTGGGRGIGRSIALRFAREGARIVVCARTMSELQETVDAVAEAGGEGLAVQMDVADLSSVEEGLAQASDYLGGKLDVLVNNAGIFTIRPLAEMSPATWYRLIAVNLNGPFHVTLLALKLLEQSDRGHIFNISSTAGKKGYAGSGAYCATKYGLRGFGDALRLELEEHGIRVSTVYPDATDTSIFDDVPGDWDRTAMNRPEDVAEVVWAGYSAPAGQVVADLDVAPPGESSGC